MRRPGGQSQFSSSLQGPPPRTPILRLVADEVAADPAADWNLTSLATLARVSPRHLTRMFTEELKVTPAQYVERIRFDVARAALDGGMNATEAATRAGFSSYEALRRTFRKRLGVSPIRYQQRFATPSRNGAVPKFRDSWLDDRPSLLIADERVG
jgi:transcriptional regulator GlxA family with amidase domain